MGLRDIYFRWSLILSVGVFIMQYPLMDCAMLVVRPKAVVAIQGSSVRLECTRDQSGQAVNWEFAPTESNNYFSYIYTHRHIAITESSRYKIDTDNETRFDIVIDHVDRDHAGTYICTPVNPGVVNSTSASAQLIVLQENPLCGSNATNSNLKQTRGDVVEGDFIKMHCRIIYFGNWIPFVQWNSTSYGVVTSYKSMDTGGTTLQTIPFYSQDNGVTIGCNISFNSRNYKHVRVPRPGETPAVNTPGYEFIWTFTLRVLYGPKDLTITPKKSTYVVGDRLVCLAKGNPDPDYVWVETSEDRKIYGPHLDIGVDLSGKNHSFKCTAQNTVAGTRMMIDTTIDFDVRAAASSTVVSSALTAVAMITEIILQWDFV